MSTFYSFYPPSGGGGVTSLNGLTGALTLVAGSGITITPSGSNITISATGGGGANTFLSNLTSPTAINQDLLPGVTANNALGSASNYWAAGFINALNTSSGTTSIDTFARVLFDSASVHSLAYGARQALDSTTGLSIDWQARNLVDSSAVLSTDWQARRLVDSGGTISLAWDDRALVNGSGTEVLNWTSLTTGTAGQFLQTDGAGDASWATVSSGANTALSNLASVAINTALLPGVSHTIDLGANTLRFRNLYVDIIEDNQPVTSIDPVNRLLVDSNGLRSLLWDARILVDVAFRMSVDWENRILYDAVQVPAMAWTTTGVEIKKSLILDGSTSGALTIQAAATTTPYTVIMPAAQGTGALTNDGAGNLSWSAGIPWDFGSGIDGSAVLDGTNTFSWADLVGSVYYMLQPVSLVNLTVNSGITLATQSHSITVSGTLTNAGTIDNSGGNGGAGGVGGQGTGGAGGIGGGYISVGTAVLLQDLGFGAIANGGSVGGTSNGVDSPGAETTTPVPKNAIGGSGGGGGAGQLTTGGTGLPDNQYVAANAYVFNRLTNNLSIGINNSIYAGNPLQGGDSGADGASGGGDGTNNGGGGGGAGGGGGVIGIWAKTFNNTGTIRANGGDGGAGESPAVSTLGVGGGGGGGSGAGGFIYILRQTNISTGTIQANGGTGGAAGIGLGTSGTNGVAGTSGNAGAVVLYTTSTGTWT